MPGEPAAPAAEGTAAPAAAGSGAKTTVTFWEPGGGGEFCAMFDTIAADFEQRNPDIDMAETTCHTGDQAFNEVLLARIAAGNPPDATILWTSPAALGARGSLRSLDDLMQQAQYAQEDNWPPGVLASCQFGGKTWGLPVTAGTYAIWYDRGMFEQKGIPSDRESFPKTWDELRRLSKEFTHWNGDTLETMGMLPLPWHVMDPHIYIWSALNGAQLYDAENRRYMLDTEPNVAMMQYAVDWLDEEYKGDWGLVNRSANWEGFDLGDGRPVALIEGRQAMMVMGFWGVNSDYNISPEVNWSVAPFPVGPNGSTTVSGYYPNWFVVPSGAQHAEAAFKWLDYMSGVGVQAWFKQVPDMPANKTVPRDLLPAALLEAKGQDFTQEITDFYRSRLDIAIPMWNSPIQNFADDQIRRMMEQVLTKTATPQAALAEAQQACQAELDSVLQGGS